LKEALLLNKTLKYLTLRGHQISAESLQLICDGCEGNKSLVSLDLSYNTFSPPTQAFHIIASFVSKTITLSKISLKGIKIPVESGRALAGKRSCIKISENFYTEGMKRNTSLVDVVIGWEGVSFDTRTIISISNSMY